MGTFKLVLHYQCYHLSQASHLVMSEYACAQAVLQRPPMNRQGSYKAAAQPPYGWKTNAEQQRVVQITRSSVSKWLKFYSKLHLKSLLFNSAPLQPHEVHGSVLWPLLQSIADSIKMDSTHSSVHFVQTDWRGYRTEGQSFWMCSTGF